MSFYDKIKDKPVLFQQITGMSATRFSSLLPQIADAYRQSEQARKSQTVVGKTTRIRAIGGGKDYGNPLADRLLMLLLYYRLYLSQDFMTLLFKAQHKSVISRSIQNVKGAIHSVLPLPARLKSALLDLAEQGGKKPQRISNVEDFKKAYPELTILIDGKEQPINRPKDKLKRKRQYSGKKKRHTLKQLITTTRNGLIVDLSPCFDGATNDFGYFKTYHTTLTQGWEQFHTVAYVDSGFQGHEDLAIPIEIRQTYKAFRNKALTKQHKQINRVRGRIRVKCEHTIGHLKRYRIAEQIYRNPKQSYDQTMNIVAGLTNLRILQRVENATGLRVNF
jgi:hypothetical protein